MEEFKEKLAKTMRDVRPLFFVLSLFVFVFALVGMQIFANKLRFDSEGYPVPISDYAAWQQAPERPRSNFDDFALSIATVFQIITLDSWNVVLDDVWRAEGAAAVAFPLVVLVLGFFVLLNQLLTFIITGVVRNVICLSVHAVYLPLQIPASLAFCVLHSFVSQIHFNKKAIR